MSVIDSTAFEELVALKRARRHGGIADPDAPGQGLSVWVAYAWSPRFSQWLVLGFLRGRLTVGRLRRFRARSGLPADVVVKYRGLFWSARYGPPTAPPMRYFTTRPDVAHAAPYDQAPTAPMFIPDRATPTTSSPSRRRKSWVTSDRPEPRSKSSRESRSKSRKPSSKLRSRSRRKSESQQRVR